MKVLHVITGANVGGAETMLARLLDHQKRVPGIEAEVATLMPPGFVGRRMAASGVSVRSLGMRSVLSAVPAFLRLVAMIRRERPDIVIAWMHHAQIAATCAVWLARTRTPVIWNVRHSLGGFTEEKWLTRLVLRVQARISKMPAAIIYNSHAAAAQYRAHGFASKRQEVIPNGIDMPTPQASVTARRLFTISPDVALIGMIARAHPMKDVANLLSAFQRICAAGMPAHLLLVGEGMDRPADDHVQALAALPKGSWTLSGHRADVGEWLGGLDILVLPSAWGEGFPNIVGEAMARSVPCVGTNVGDMEWIIGATGRTVPPRNPAALAAALTELLTMPAAERKALGAAAQERIRTNFALADIASRYAALCREIVNLPVDLAHPYRAERSEAA
ncbi:MAG: glycosyltransferase [Sphingobium sp.]|uniref:glycosyltransferase n=1 Tax=Sphingobium sp. TaxID=1912891 RepID=UPI0029A75577|nr:glycosyltransferase [Sphingobium sp.]MDX3909602.1 glycosyltransferase [Sphingobium sp.]